MAVAKCVELYVAWSGRFAKYAQIFMYMRGQRVGGEGVVVQKVHCITVQRGWGWHGYGGWLVAEQRPDWSSCLLLFAEQFWCLARVARICQLVCWHFPSFFLPSLPPPRLCPLILFVSLCKLWCCRRYGTRLHLTVSPGERSLRFVDATLNAKTSEFYCCFIDGFTCQTSESIAIRKFIWRTRKCLKGIQKIQNSASSSGEKQFISLRFGT